MNIRLHIASNISNIRLHIASNIRLHIASNIRLHIALHIAWIAELRFGEDSKGRKDSHFTDNGKKCLFLRITKPKSRIPLNMRKTVAVLGDASANPDSFKYKLAFETGKMLVDRGYRVQSGGMGGIMEAVCAGAHASKNYREGDTIGILPSFDRTKANEYVDILIPTGLDIIRNGMTGCADAVIAIGGGAGTLMEMAAAWSTLKLIIAYRTVPGWSAELADRRIDGRIRYPEIPDDRVYGADTPEEVGQLLQEHIEAYTRQFAGISRFDPRKKESL